MKLFSFVILRNSSKRHAFSVFQTILGFSHGIQTSTFICVCLHCRLHSTPKNTALLSKNHGLLKETLKQTAWYWRCILFCVWVTRGSPLLSGHGYNLCKQGPSCLLNTGCWPRNRDFQALLPLWLCCVPHLHGKCLVDSLELFWIGKTRCIFGNAFQAASQRHPKKGTTQACMATG